MPKPDPNTERPAEDAAEFFRRHVRNARPENLLKFLDMAPDRPPEPGDELPHGLRNWSKSILEGLWKI
jgi:hypothetical protein